jgi:hypothetical protein
MQYLGPRKEVERIKPRQKGTQALQPSGRQGWIQGRFGTNSFTRSLGLRVHCLDGKNSTTKGDSQVHWTTERKALGLQKNLRSVAPHGGPIVLELWDFPGQLKISNEDENHIDQANI